MPTHKKGRQMKIEKRKFRIGELAKRLGVECFVVRFWEKEFALKSMRSTGRQRFYNDDDLAKFQTIKKLLYEEGFTIAGAKKQLESSRKKTAGAQKTTLSSQTIIPARESHVAETKDEKLPDQLAELQEKLMQLRELL